jgi:hypothetical protein
MTRKKRDVASKNTDCRWTRPNGSGCDGDRVGRYST